MSASSSAASSSLTRSRTAVFLIGALAAAYGVYYYHTTADFDLTASNAAATGLHRSNAIHRRRRQTGTIEENDDDRAEPSLDTTGLIPLVEDDTNAPTARPLGDDETVIDDPALEDWSNWDDDPPSHRNGQNIVQLLFRVSEDATRRNAYVHRGCQCNSCGTVPIRGIRYRCSNCADFDLCEGCEAQGMHIKTHVFYKVRVPTTAFASRQMQPVWYPGDPDHCQTTFTRELITKLSKETGFERPELEAYWEQWTFMANTEWREDPDDLCLAMDRRTFDQCLVPSGGNRVAPNLIHDRMFAFYDQNNDGVISFPEFLSGLAYRRKKDKLKRVFEGYDINGDGFVDRKDFLRIFRSYYVLYKQMHRDMLEGLDDQVMNGTQAHKLVTSRGPLSRAFGEDGRFPSAPDPRTGEGKSSRPDGDLEITDGKGVIRESSKDHGSKEDVLIDAVLRQYSQNGLDEVWGPEASDAYWRAVTRPPETVAELQHNVLEGLIRDRENHRAHDGSAPQSRTLTNSELYEVVVLHDLRDFVADWRWPPNWVKPEDVEAVYGEQTALEDIPEQRRLTILERARERLRALRDYDRVIAVEDEIRERWKRRQFYTDEEEGGEPPRDWTSEEDIAKLNEKAGESSNAGITTSQHITPRSRSSSKVRFADDDDYDTRSNATNASTSSRSVAERWGGFEIPEAEKDAGKEILYQVTQQAFNELLNPLFKKKEDLAVVALSSKDLRNRYRHMFSNDTFEHWAIGVDESLNEWDNPSIGNTTEAETDLRAWRARPSLPKVELQELNTTRNKDLEDLLAESGYTVDENDTPLHRHDSLSATKHPSPYSSDNMSAPKVNSNNSNHNEKEPYHDPTFPQFRPNSMQELDQLPPSNLRPVTPVSTAQSDHYNTTPVETEATTLESILRPHDPSSPLAPRIASSSKPQPLPSRSSSPRRAKLSNDAPTTETFNRQLETLITQTNRFEALKSMPEDVQREFKRVDWMALFKLRDLEKVEKEAEDRGGWGRISWQEFEGMIKGDESGDRDARSRVMDYLGSWIEFCIP